MMINGVILLVLMQTIQSQRSPPQIGHKIRYGVPNIKYPQSIVKIFCKRPIMTSYGTGFFVRDDIILTADHVIQPCDSHRLVFNGTNLYNHTIRTILLSKSFDKLDMGLIQIHRKYIPFNVLPLRLPTTEMRYSAYFDEYMSVGFGRHLNKWRVTGSLQSARIKLVPNALVYSYGLTTSHYRMGDIIDIYPPTHQYPLSGDSGSPLILFSSEFPFGLVGGVYTSRIEESYSRTIISNRYVSLLSADMKHRMATIILALSI